jgi:hypothetical protein
MGACIDKQYPTLKPNESSVFKYNIELGIKVRDYRGKVEDVEYLRVRLEPAEKVRHFDHAGLSCSL